MSVLLLVLAARAQEFPADDSWLALPCRGNPMTDPFRDEPRAEHERDLVGELTAAAGYRSADSDFAYLRMRLDRDPFEEGDPRPFAWGFELDTDGDRTTYEVLVLVDGDDREVRLFRNTEIQRPDDPTDPPDEPALASWPIEVAARSLPAPSLWGGDGDAFLDVAIPWESFVDVGIFPFAPVTSWLVTSSDDDPLDGDFSCHDAASGEGRTLSGGFVPDREPEKDSDGDGFSDRVEDDKHTNPTDPSSFPLEIEPDSPLLEGGGGCSTTGGPGWAGWMALVGLGWGARRSRRGLGSV